MPSDIGLIVIVVVVATILTIILICVSAEATSTVLQALLSGCVLISVLLFMERYKARCRRSEYASSIYQELEKMRLPLWPEYGTRSQPHGRLFELPHNIYDGMVSSAAISSLSDGLQQRLGTFYGLVRDGKYDAVMSKLDIVMVDVHAERSVMNLQFWERYFWKRYVWPRVVSLVERVGIVRGRLMTMTSKSTTTIITRLKTHAELYQVLNKPGFLVVKKRPGGRSRIHKTSCRSFWFEIEMGKLGVGLDAILGRGKAKQEYYHCETWDDAVKKWRELMQAREPRPCSKCRPDKDDST